MRRGLTLLELLLAVALLAGVASALVPMTRIALGGMQKIDQDLLWQRSAGMSLSEINFVLLRRDRRESRDRPVLATERTLRIRLAGDGALTLQLEDDQLTIEQAGEESRVLLGQVSGVEFDYDNETGILRVRLTSSGDLSAERSWDIGS